MWILHEVSELEGFLGVSSSILEEFVHHAALSEENQGKNAEELDHLYAIITFNQVNKSINLNEEWWYILHLKNKVED